MANLASTYHSQGRWDEAEKTFVDVINAREAKLGSDHPDTLGSMANLASTHRRGQGKWDNAHSLLLDVANKMQHVIRPQDPMAVLHYFKQHDEILKEKEHM